MKKMTLLVVIMLLVQFLIVDLASALQSGEVYELVVPGVRVRKYTVVRYDNLWRISKHFYGSATMKMCKTLAKWKNQVSHPKLWVFPGQTLEIPLPLIQKQERISQSPTTMSIEKTAELSVRQFKKNLTRVGTYIDMPKHLAKEIVIGVKQTRTVHSLNNELVTTVSFSKRIQSWTEVRTKERLEGKSAIIKIDEKYAMRATWAREQCNNLYLQLLKKAKKDKKVVRIFDFPPPPRVGLLSLLPPPLPPPLPPIIKKELRESLLAVYGEIGYRWDWDSTWGAFDEHYHDGNDVRGWWQTSVFYPAVFDDLDGNEWSFGIALSTRDWKGETGDADPFNYEGDMDFWSLVGRYRDPEHKLEVVGRAGLGKRTDVGYSVNQFGRYDTTQWTDIFNFYTSTEYNRDKSLFSKVRGSFELEKDIGHQKADFWTDQWSGRVAQNGPPDNKDAYHLSLYADVYSFDDAKTVQVWTEGRTSYYDEQERLWGGIKGGLSFFNSSFKVGAGAGLVKRSDFRTGFDGLYAEMSFYALYHEIFGYDDQYKGFRFVNQGASETEILRILGVKGDATLRVDRQSKKEQEILDILKGG